METFYRSLLEILDDRREPDPAMARGQRVSNEQGPAGFLSMLMVIELYESLGESDRWKFVDALRRILDEDKHSPVMLGRIIDLAADLEIDELEFSIVGLLHRLEGVKPESRRYIRQAIEDYLARRSSG